ncbi:MULTISPECIES: aldo/keto reductase [unclassified Microbacterium]|uniref:aldo/keto reductase n=1 Tax=unclassified Microbacterium TaxID=2609290 RepID=UPI000CFD24BA|nr:MULTISPECIES: aldo/keto reductase [unclassified Microbacterium]PQZ50934.1 aldo/keto reductase [Microbacterium sp. MYb43]PQZ72694.1 aldo/keto reductase [Microbacterium sp. MYb40]PRB16439.1 aldo/keto reductase [Microbacterium sp. MYb54]PRB31422.1 aldo/keto reductase [Microbacterium sp. MYb50]PRB67705.1 aldo/keto reductase [Microbacterium sp. MYb32]
MSVSHPDFVLPTTTIGAGVPLTRIGLGAAQFGNMHRVTSDLESEAAVIAAWDAGIRYFDTAPHYGLGLSERRLGRALQAYPRADFVVSTKVGRLLVPSPETAGEQDPEGFVVPATVRRRWDFSRDGILRSVESSLERLGLDHLDIVYLHDPDEHWDAASTTGIDALIELRDQGVVRAVGAGMNQSRMLAEFIRRSDVDVVMVAGRYTLLDRGAEEELLPVAEERGVGVVAAGVYNSGLLSAEVVADDALFDYAPAPRALIDRARALAALAAHHGITLPEAAVQFPLKHPAVVSVVLGTRTSAHVRSSVSRAAKAIPEPFWKELAGLGQG